jgi:hypothetical protein
MANFSFNNVDVVTMARGTDAAYSFQYTLPSGSVFVPANYTIVCEGRLAIDNETADFTFPVTSVNDPTLGWILTISFPKTNITYLLREQKVYWRVLATDSNGLTSQINKGEIWLS